MDSWSWILILSGYVAEWNLVNEDGVMKLRQSWTVKTFAKGLEFFRIVAVLAKNEGIMLFFPFIDEIYIFVFHVLGIPGSKVTIPP